MFIKYYFITRGHRTVAMETPTEYNFGLIAPINVEFQLQRNILHMAK